MSLEKAMADLQAAIEANTAALKGAKPAAAAKGDDDEKPARRSRASKDDAPADDEKPARRKKEEPAEAEIDIETVRGVVAKFLGPKDEEDYDKNSEFIESVLDEVGADTVKDIKSKDFKAVVYWVNKKRKNPDRKVDFDDRGEDAEEKPARRRRTE